MPKHPQKIEYKRDSRKINSRLNKTSYRCLIDLIQVTRKSLINQIFNAYICLLTGVLNVDSLSFQPIISHWAPL